MKARILTSLLKKMFAATGLTGRGRVMEATAAMQKAFADRVAGSMAPPAAPPAAPATPQPAPTRATAERTTAPRPDATVERPSRFDQSSFTGATGTRLFKLFEPAGFGDTPLPMVVMLHGCTQSPDDFAAGTRMNALARELGWFVLYPAQAPRSNANKCWNWFVPEDQRRGHGEPALIAGMTRHVMDTHPVDADRVYVAGLSAGGAMAAILAREYPDLYAAAGVHSGLAAGAAQDVGSAFTAMKTGASGTAPVAAAGWPGRPVVVVDSSGAARAGSGSGAGTGIGAPVIAFHGDADSTVNAVNGSHVVDATLGDKGAWQASRESGKAADGRGFTRTVYRPEGAGPDVPSRAEHWVVHGAGHAWSGGDKSGSYADARGPDASREMLRFFAAHPRRS